MDIYHLKTKHLLLKSVIIFLYVNFCCCFVHNISFAQQTVEKYGVVFEVDSIASTGVGQSLVRLGNQEQIISDIRIPNYVVREYLNSEELFKKLGLGKVFQLLNASIRNEDPVLYLEVLESVSRYTVQSDEGFNQFFENLTNQENISDKIITLLESKSLVEISPSSLPEFLSILILKGQSPFSDAITQILQSKSLLIKDSLKRRFFDAVKASQLLLAKDISEKFISKFGIDNSDSKNILKVLDKLNGTSSGDDLGSILVQLSSQDPELNKSLSIIALDLLYGRVQKFIDNQDPVSALSELSMLDLDKRTPKTHELVIQIYEKLEIKDLNRILEEQKIRNFLKFLSEKDQNLREKCIEVLEKLAITAVEQNQNTDFNPIKIFELLNDFRSDPNSLNDRLRIKLIELAKSLNQPSLATQIRSEIKTSLSIFDRFNLLLIFIKYNWIYLLILFFVSFIFIKLIKDKFLSKSKKQKKHIKNNVDESSTNSNDQIELEPKPLFVKGAGKSNQYLNQYVELMMEFDLRPDASDKDLKTAYRNIMKGIHPDIVGAGVKHTQDFIHYQNVYERILEYRKKLGLEDKN
jgi:hypothetical protein